jgi:hypothetical protein
LWHALADHDLWQGHAAILAALSDFRPLAQYEHQVATDQVATAAAGRAALPGALPDVLSDSGRDTLFVLLAWGLQAHDERRHAAVL